MYGRADGMPSVPQSMVVYDNYLTIWILILDSCGLKNVEKR